MCTEKVGEKTERARSIWYIGYIKKKKNNYNITDEIRNIFQNVNAVCDSSNGCFFLSFSAGKKNHFHVERAWTLFGLSNAM